MSEDGTNHEEVLRRAAENTELSLALRRACQAAVMSNTKTSRLGDWLELDARVSALKEQRDEARQRCCLALMGTGVWRQPRMDLPGGSWTPRLIAQEFGWDCFKEVQP
jgi:hypothetical protein